MITPPRAPPTITPTLLKDCDAEEEVDVELGLPGAVVMAEVSRAPEWMGEVDNEDEPVDEEGYEDEPVDEEGYIDDVLDKASERKPIGFWLTPAPSSKKSPWFPSQQVSACVPTPQQ